MPKKKPRDDHSKTPESAPFNPAFRALEALKGKTSDEAGDDDPSVEASPSIPVENAPLVEEGPGSSAASPEGVVSRATKLVVRKEKKGRGGKTVTRVDGLTGDPSALAAVARALAKALGSGATLEEGSILVQGAQSPRVAEWLRARGARQVVIGDAPPKR